MDNCIVCGGELVNGVCSRCGYNENTVNNSHHLPVGSKLNGNKYTVGNVVGAGGFGVVYAAWDSVLQIKVAIKEYMPGELSTRAPGTSALTIYDGESTNLFASGMRKFFDESHRLSTFTEVPGIVQIFDCFYENNTAYIVMEFLDGQTLEQILKERGSLPVDEALGIICPVLDALEIVHKEGIIHRDIAPNNIFITKDGRIKLLDFGAARDSVRSNSTSLTVLFKEGFTAEEQYNSRGEQGPWTDVYSAAATLYKTITGETPEGALDRKSADNLKAPSKMGIKLDQNVDTAIMNALNVSAKQRTQTAADFKAELTGGKDVKLHYERSSEKPTSKIPLPVWIMFAAGAVAILAIVVLMLTGVISFQAGGFAGIFTAEDKVRVMNIVNMELSEAEDLLNQNGLSLEITEYKIDNSVMKGRIISQAERKGTLVDKGSVVHVIVSNEYNEVIVPSAAWSTSTMPTTIEDNSEKDSNSVSATPTGSAKATATTGPTPTKQPTAKPQDQNTQAGPTPTTGANPAANPTPTIAPTSRPTAAPTATPTPRFEPTSTPTPQPPQPGFDPTATPTPMPDIDPTATPTPEPEMDPTATPTPEPELDPTATPTPIPDIDPTATPTPMIEFDPTATPTPEP